MLDDQSWDKEKSGHEPNGEDDASGNAFIEELAEDDWMPDGKVTFCVCVCDQKTQVLGSVDRALGGNINLFRLPIHTHGQDGKDARAGSYA